MMQHFRDRPDRAPGKRARAGAGAGRELNLSKLREKKAGGPGTSFTSGGVAAALTEIGGIASDIGPAESIQLERDFR